MMKTYSPNYICSLLILLLAAGLSGCGGSADSSATAAAAQLSLPATASVGQLLFNDPALSASGKQSCATCHAPGSAFSAGNNAAVQLGGAALTLQGVRNTPTAMYASFIPGFVLNAPRPPNAPVGSASLLNPRGGIMHDGRLANLAEQAQKPFITSFEMGNSGSAQVLQRLLARPYLAQFTAAFGQAVLSDPDATLAAMGQAIAAFETTTPSFHPFSSKFDAFINGQVTLTVQEAAGFAAFTATDRGHCASCHTSTGTSSSPAQFTNYSYHVLGVPRNWQISYNLDSTTLPDFVPANGSSLGAPNHNYYDMGLCGPFRTDMVNETTLCGAFKVPTLRNVGIKQTYFHNGVFASLNDVVSFYATRNSNPSRWYVKPDGTPDILYNDLPVIYAANVDPVNHPGGPIAPNLNATDIQNIVSFLCTLNDGFDAKNPAAYNASGQCAGL